MQRFTVYMAMGGAAYTELGWCVVMNPVVKFVMNVVMKAGMPRDRSAWHVHGFIHGGVAECGVSNQQRKRIAFVPYATCGVAVGTSLGWLQASVRLSDLLGSGPRPLEGAIRRDLGSVLKQLSEPSW